MWAKHFGLPPKEGRKILDYSYSMFFIGYLVFGALFLFWSRGVENFLVTSSMQGWGGAKISDGRSFHIPYN